MVVCVLKVKLFYSSQRYVWIARTQDTKSYRLWQLNVTTGKLRSDFKRDKKAFVGAWEVNIWTFFKESSCEKHWLENY